MSATRWKKFSGPLAEPIEDRDNDPRLVYDEQMRKLDRLFEHYGIVSSDDTKDYRELARILACQFVPGFRERRFRGQPRRPLAKNIALLFDVKTAIDRAARKRRKRTVSEAVALLCRRQGPWRGANKRVLENMYHQALRDPRLYRDHKK